MDFREEAATSGVPKNKILAFFSVESPEGADEYKGKRDRDWGRRRGSSTPRDEERVGAGGARRSRRAALAPTPRDPSWKPQHGRMARAAAMVEAVAITTATLRLTERLVVTECAMVGQEARGAHASERPVEGQGKGHKRSAGVSDLQADLIPPSLRVGALTWSVSASR